MKRKILILANNDMGLYKFRKELIEELLNNNDVAISLPDGEFIKPLEELGCSFINTDINRRGTNPITDLKLLFSYINILRREAPDMVITYTIKPNIYGGLVCGLHNIPFAVNVTGLGTAFQFDNWIKRIVVFLYRLALKKVKIVFFENTEDKQIFIKNGIVNEDKACLLMGAGVNLKTYSLIEYPKEDMTRFLFIGRVMKEKGINELFDSMRELIADGEKVHLDVVGGLEEDYRNIISKYENEGWLTYHGVQKDVRPFIANCHCFVLPSWHEGMANTNLEAAACGRPVITSRIHGCLESVIDGVTGFLVERNNKNELYKKMKEFSKITIHRRREMGLLGRTHMKSKFDKRSVVGITVSRIYCILKALE